MFINPADDDCDAFIHSDIDAFWNIDLRRMRKSKLQIEHLPLHCSSITDADKSQAHFKPFATPMTILLIKARNRPCVVFGISTFSSLTTWRRLPSTLTEIPFCAGIASVPFGPLAWTIPSAIFTSTFIWEWNGRFSKT